MGSASLPMQEEEDRRIKNSVELKNELLITCWLFIEFQKVIWASHSSKRAFSNKQILREAHKKGQGIVCDCCNSQPLQAPETPVFLATSRGQGLTVPFSSLQIAISGGLVRAPHNTGDTEPVLRKARHLEVSEEIRNQSTSLVTHPGPSHIGNFLPADELPKKVISSFHQGSDVKTMDFHPEHQTMLLGN